MLQCKYILSYCKAISDIGLKNGGILACAGVERFRFQQLNLTNFANGNSMNASYYFFVVFQAVHTLIILWSRMVTITVDLFVIFRNLGF